MRNLARKLALQWFAVYQGTDFDREEAVSHVIDEMYGWNDERKADLYSRVIEHEGFADRYSDLEEVFHDALTAHTRELLHG